MKQKNKYILISQTLQNDIDGIFKYLYLLITYLITLLPISQNYALIVIILLINNKKVKKYLY